MPRRSDPPVVPSSPPPQRKLAPLQPRRWKFGLFPSSLSIHPFGTRDVDRSANTTLCNANVGPTVERTSDNKSDTSRQGLAAVGTQGLQVSGRPSQTVHAQNYVTETEESEYTIGCCGLYFVRRRSAS
ncbi:hypothetical protein K503DRAFT_130551 [Rhizopogon vinicolor AM-OR11-026]|uniref:Uncharacterized protein n=1 Tax=Rhizopogon vinicolor AM-OR11-026 TaxID=1314800 RepID=A0A1B7MEK8_9AGAM|nr:hypothetical protein K503DRAFT_130551 [Rhizopogon vinicolor AM-OR11-026]